jgi:hypothetical protein
LKLFWILGILGLVVIVLFTTAPVISVSIAGAIASANNCQLDEGSVHTCMVNGRDLGQTLYSMGVLGWFMLVTIPVGLVVLVVYLVGMAIVGVLLSRRQKRKELSDADLP